MKRSEWIVVGLVVIVAIAACMLVISQRDHYKKELVLRDQTFQARVDLEKVKITEDLEEKYRADRISYEVMARQMAKHQNSLRDQNEQEK